MAIAPSSSGASFVVRKMAVGPSAPPMMPMEAACGPVKPSRISAEEGDEHAELRRRAEEQALRIGDQRAKVGHRADAHEDDGRIDTGLDADVEHVKQSCIRAGCARSCDSRSLSWIEEGVPKLRVIQCIGGVQIRVDGIEAGEVADVGQQAAERDADEQQRLKALDDAKVQQHAGNDDHYEVSASRPLRSRKSGRNRSSGRIAYAEGVRSNS